MPRLWNCSTLLSTATSITVLNMLFTAITIRIVFQQQKIEPVEVILTLSVIKQHNNTSNNIGYYRPIGYDNNNNNVSNYYKSKSKMVNNNYKGFLFFKQCLWSSRSRISFSFNRFLTKSIRSQKRFGLRPHA